jgi:hypothetical protein
VNCGGTVNEATVTGTSIWMTRSRASAKACSRTGPVRWPKARHGRGQAVTCRARSAAPSCFTPALPLFGCAELVVANLLNTPTKDAPELNRRMLTEVEVEASRAELALAIGRADEVLLAWGTGGMTGDVRSALRRQVAWLYGALVARGIERVWTVTGRPRHPSRWRQYVGPEKRRVEGGCFEERLEKPVA